MANASATLGADWTPRGSTNWVSGFANDMVLNTPITGNNTSVSVFLKVPSELPLTPGGFPSPPSLFSLASGWVDPTNGSYNLSFEIPPGIPSGVYEMEVRLDFTENPPGGDPFYNPGEYTIIPAGIQTEFVVQTDPSAIILLAGEQLILNSNVSDVEDSSRLIAGAQVQLIFDWGGPLEEILQSGVTDANGQFSFDPVISATTPPGFYNVRIVALDDLSDNLSVENAGRWLGNHTTVNLTIQVDSSVQISSIPAQVSALQPFVIEGSVLDSADSSRVIEGPVGISVFFLDEPEELLIENHSTNSTGFFSVIVPTDTLGNGVIRGVRTVVVSVVNGSTPFYLTGTGNAPILVMGVSQFVDSTPFINTIVERGNNAIITTRLVEFSNNEAPLSGFTIQAKFHETWLNTESTATDGSVAFEFEVPHDHPLGVVNVTLLFNGSGDLNPAVKILSTITVRSSTTMVIDQISSNPLPGEFFNVTGSLTSSNGTGLTDRSGNALNPSLTFTIDSDPDNFTVSNVAFDSNGNWVAQLRLDLSFPRGTHFLGVEFTPLVNYFSSASGSEIFDSRGFSLLTIESPDDLDPDARTVRGEEFAINLSLVDNSGSPVESATVVVKVGGITAWGGITNSLGKASASILVRDDRPPGPIFVNASFAGFNGSTGLIGDETWTRVIVLAPSVLVLESASVPSIAGRSVTFTGSLLDERGNYLEEAGSPLGGLIRLSINGIDVGPSYTTVSNSTSGRWVITYQVPEDMLFGPHSARVDFLGGYSWVDPMGQGDSINPEYYLPSFDMLSFDVTQPSQLVISTPPGEIDRTEVASIEGFLTDSVGRAIAGRELSLKVSDELLTTLITESNGSFVGYVAIAPDMQLGPLFIEIEFLGEEFILPSNSTLVLSVYSPVFISIDESHPVAAGEDLTISGMVKDNLEEGWLEDQTLEIYVDDILVGITSSTPNGSWSLQWTVPESMEIGNHSISVVSPSQGFYRMANSISQFTVSYHTEISIQVEQLYSTRGGNWNLSGRLFESDTGFQSGLEGREISILLDGKSVGLVTTGEGGLFDFEQRVRYSLSRGSHNISFQYEGEFLYLLQPSPKLSLLFPTY